MEKKGMTVRKKDPRLKKRKEAASGPNLSGEVKH